MLVSNSTSTSTPLLLNYYIRVIGMINGRGQVCILKVYILTVLHVVLTFSMQMPDQYTKGVYFWCYELELLVN